MRIAAAGTPSQHTESCPSLAQSPRGVQMRGLCARGRRVNGGGGLETRYLRVADCFHLIDSVFLGQVVEQREPEVTEVCEIDIGG